MKQSRTGLLYIRAWFETASTMPLRAHVTETLDVSLGEYHEQNLADADAVCGTVQRWLDELAAS